MRHLALLLTLALSAAAWARPAAEYLPPDADLDPAIPTPESVLGWEIGDWRISHDLLVKYLERLADASDRVTIEVIGRTHEQRPLMHLVITSPANQGRLEDLRQAHLADAYGDGDGDGPLVLWQGYSVHGNEASGSNAAPLWAYYLAASRSPRVTEWLENTVVLLDPSFNPDGLNRFATWSNANRSLNPVGDTNHRIHDEDWPQNRTNHYLFDLNRDWLPTVHPESRARIERYHRWLPHVLTDHHEAFSQEGYFFQPGVPSRTNPLTPPRNQELTALLGDYHARALDAVGQRYYTREVFDDFYYGKGSTYPDINGSVGILFEQTRVNGPVKNIDDGVLRFEDAVRNQFLTSVSTLEGAHALRADLKAYQRDFFRTTARRADDAGFAAWIIGNDGDAARGRSLVEVLRRHRVEVRELAEDVRAGGRAFRAGGAWVVPARQRQFGLAQGMMQQLTRFEDETFYDVSAWTLPLAWNLPYATAGRLPETRPLAEDIAVPAPSRDAVAWLVPWSQAGAPPLLQRLLDAGARVRAASKPFTIDTDRGERAFARGTLLVHLGIQPAGLPDTLHALLADAAEGGVTSFAAPRGLSTSGPDLGSSEFETISPLRPLLVAGEGTSAYEVGEAWHQLDLRLGLAPVMIAPDRLGRMDLEPYTHLIMVDGSYGGLGERVKAHVAAWVSRGGILVASRRAATWAESLCLGTPAGACGDNGNANGEPAETPEPRAYADFEADDARRVVGGAIVAGRLDLTHPLGWGYAREDIALFRRGTVALAASANPYATPLRFAEEPLLSGFMGPERIDALRGQPAGIVERHGQGLVVRFSDNPLFRGFWRGTERLWVNALYMGQAVERTQLPD